MNFWYYSLAYLVSLPFNGFLIFFVREGGVMQSYPQGIG